MSLLASFIAALERTGGERLVLKSGEPPHLLVGDARRDLGTATVSNKALAALTAQILSAEAQQIFAKTDAADEPLTLSGTTSTPSLFVEARRSGSDTSITLRRIPPPPSAPPVEPARPAVPLAEPAPPAVASVPPTPPPVAPVVPAQTAVASVEPAPPSIAVPPVLPEPIVAPGEQAHAGEPDKTSEWEPIDLAAPAPPVAADLPVRPPTVAVDPPAPAPTVAADLPAPAATVAADLPAPATTVAAEIPAPAPMVLPAPAPTVAADLAAPASVAAVVESKSAPAADEPAAIAIPESPPEPTVMVDTAPAFIAALNGSERLVFRSGEPPHLLIGDIRHNLDTATVSNNALEGLAAHILSEDAQRTFAATNSVVEPLSGAVSTTPLLVEARRTGSEICIEMRRGPDPEPVTAVMTAVEPSPTPVAAPPTPVEPRAASARPTENVPERAEPLEWAATDTPAAALETAGVAEPEPVRAAVAPTAGPIRIVAFPPQEPKAAVAGAFVPGRRVDTSALEYWIREAARHDATALYLRGGQAPVMRVRERVEPLTGDPLEGSLIQDVTAAFTANDDEWRSASDGEWVREYDGVGEVRCQAFTDDLGLGLVVRLSARDSASTLQKYIPRQVRRSCEEDDGIVLVSAEAAGDVLAMVAASAQWTAKKRAGYLISIEPPNGLGHDITGTFVSARRIDGPPEAVAAAIRQAAQQRPDILVVALPSGMAAEEAIRAARPGCLVILGVVAPTAPRALESLLSLVNPHIEPQMRRSLAAALRCGFSHRAPRRIGGGRTIVHDVLIASREVREGLGQRDFGALDTLQRSGAGGMRSLDAALARAVQRREISLRQAAMHASDRGEVIRLVRQASRARVRMSRERPGVLRAVAGASGTQPL